jgi:hypothetical protein
MTTPSTDDRTIRTAFAELRYDEPPRFLPPGVDAARRTVRLRRQGRVAVAAHLAVVAILVGGYLAGAATDDGGQGTAPAPQPAAPPTETSALPWLAEEMYQELADPELAMLVHEIVGGDALENGMPIPGAHISVGDRLNLSATATGGQILHPGTPYVLRIGCAGTGTVTFTYRIGERVPGGPITPEEAGGEQGQLTAECAGTAEGIAAGVAETTVSVDDPDQWLNQWLEADAHAHAHSPLLYSDAIIPIWPEGVLPTSPPPANAGVGTNRDTDELIALAEGALFARWPDVSFGFESDEEIPVPGQAVSAGSGTYVDGMSSGESFRPGTYRLALSCVADEGTITVIAEVRGERYSATAECAMTADQVEAGIGEVTFVIEEMWEGVAITYESDATVPPGTQPIYADMIILVD